MFSKKFKASGLANIRANDSGVVNNKSGIETIDAIEAMTNEGFDYYLQGNIMKYLWRFDYKGKPLEDLQKAQWYLNTLIEDTVASDES